MAGAGKKNADYWKRRFEAMEDAGYQKSREYYERIQKAFDRAERSIRADLERWYTRLAKNNHISLAEAKKLLGRDELAEFKWTVEDYIKAGEENALNQNWMKELENASARHHINYLNAMKIQIRQHAEELYARYESSLAKHLSDTFRDTYYHTAYEIETGLEVGSSLAQPDTRKIDTFINRPWAAGLNPGERVTVIGIYQGQGRLTATTYNHQPLQQQLGVTPVYPLKEGITQKMMQQIMKKTFLAAQSHVEEQVPSSLRAQYRLLPRRTALRCRVSAALGVMPRYSL